LKKIVDDPSLRRGLVAFDRLRFDQLPPSLTPEELQHVEEQVNSWIAEAHSAQIELMPIAEAKALGAIAMFGEKYGDVVRVIDPASQWSCGGTHVRNTAEIGVLKSSRKLVSPLGATVEAVADQLCWNIFRCAIA